MASFGIRICDWNTARPLARPVRESVFILEQGVPRELEWDDADEASRHALALDAEGKCIGTARLLPDGHLGRMAVLAAWRRRGVGSALAKALVDQAAKHGHRRVVLHAQTHAAAFYRQLGFREEGGEFEEAGIPHVLMSLELGAPT
jgi:predicted GNAT family N-acyltransferase